MKATPRTLSVDGYADLDGRSGFKLAISRSTLSALYFFTVFPLGLALLTC